MRQYYRVAVLHMNLRRVSVSGKTLQIHHIDETPSNSITTNLAVLCLECHNTTQVSGGFGRQLNRPLVIKYRDDWLSRVKARRSYADKIAVEQYVQISGTRRTERTVDEKTTKAPPLSYINALPVLREELLSKGQPEWDSGVTSRMVQASYDYIDSLQAILVTLAGYYPQGHFDGSTPVRYFSDLIASRFHWHHSHVEPGGPGTGGTIIHGICCGNVINDVETMVKDMVMSLVGYDDDFDWKAWPKKWCGKKIPQFD